MDLDDGNNANDSEMWEWQEGEYSLQGDSRNDVSLYLWDELNQNGDNLLDMLDEQTPIKDCADLGHQVSDIGDYTNKVLEECRETSLLKRRRMLQFTSDTTETGIGNEQVMPDFSNSKVWEGSLMDDELSENLQWDSQWNLGFTDDGCSSGFEGFDQASQGWLVNCLNESELQYSPNEANEHVTTDDQVDISAEQSYASSSKFYDISPEMEADAVQEKPPLAPTKILRGRKSFIKTPRKLTSSVAYPFALIKPCGVQGDVTLKDINQRIHAPPPSRSKHVKKDNPSFSYPTSAFSGKPVVVKTKIHTEGGKGSITITRTKG